jgi:hypothetical protein
VSIQKQCDDLAYDLWPCVCERKPENLETAGSKDPIPISTCGPGQESDKAVVTGRDRGRHRATGVEIAEAQASG